MPVGPKVNASSAQGSLEYLLILGVVILITAVVIGVLTGVLSFGRLSASREQADSVYTGLQDVMDLSKGRTLLNLKLKQGENVLEFNDTVRKTIWTIFGNLPENSQIIFSGATCKDNPEITNIDANKKPDGSGFNFKQNPNATSQGTIVNLCVVPTDTKVTINVPEDTEINVPVEKEGEVYLEISTDKDFNAAIWANPSGYFKLTNDIDLQDFLSSEWTTQTPIAFNITFSGVIDGGNKKISYPYNFSNNKYYLFKDITTGAEMKNVSIQINDDSDNVQSIPFLATNCPPQIKNNTIDVYYCNQGNCSPNTTSRTTYCLAN